MIHSVDISAPYKVETYNRFITLVKRIVVSFCASFQDRECTSYCFALDLGNKFIVKVEQIDQTLLLVPFPKKLIIYEIFY